MTTIVAGRRRNFVRLYEQGYYAASASSIGIELQPQWPISKSKLKRKTAHLEIVTAAAVKCRAAIR